MSKKLTIAGVTSGVGSMLIGAKQMGFKVLGNVEWRNYYNTGTFEHNFDAPYTTDYDDLDHLKGADVVMVHDDCGDFSGLNMTGKKKTDIQCQGKIPMTVAAVKEIDPKFFAMDNLPKMVDIFPAQYWIDQFPDYDIYFEWISNHHYGNPQKNRKRFFIIGAKKELNFVFKPSEFEQDLHLDNILEDAELFENHIEVNLEDKIKGMSKIVDEKFNSIITWQDLQVYRQKETPTGLFRSRDSSFVLSKNPGKLSDVPRFGNLMYLSPDGSIRQKPGSRQNPLTYSMVITGGLTVFHHRTGLPLTIRERAMIQGIPNDFKFILSDKEHMGGKGFRQVGKAMPVQFTTYLTELFKNHLEGVNTEATGQRMIANNKYIDQIKLDYCEEIGYGLNQRNACERCWLNKTCMYNEY